MPRVLVVEDEAIAAMAICLMLESMDCTVIGSAARGQEAIDLAYKLHPDLVLMDIRLKGEMSGIESAKIIQARLHIPVIFTTAYSADEIRERCDINGRCLFITKPIKEDVLAQAISAACGPGKPDEPG